MTQCIHIEPISGRCTQDALTVPDKSEPSTIQKPIDKICGLTVMWGSKLAEHKLCYFHHKKSLGLFGEENKRLLHWIEAMDGR